MWQKTPMNITATSLTRSDAIVTDRDAIVSNGDDDSNPDLLIWEQCLIALFISCTILLTGISNVVNLVIIKNNIQIRSVTKIFLTSLTVTDLCVGIVCEPFGLASVIANRWPVSDALCTVVGCLVNTFCSISIASLLLISMDRYIAITRPLRYHKILTSKRAKQMTTVCWSFCFLFMSGCSYVWGPYVDYHPAIFGCTVNWNAYNDKKSVLVSCLMFVALPSLMIFIMYTRVFWIAYRHSKDIARIDPQSQTSINDHQEHSFRQNLISLRDNKALRTFVYVWVAFNIAWIPYVSCNIYMLVEEDLVEPAIEFTITWLALSNSWWNVIIYSTNDSFRQTAAGIVCRCRNKINQSSPYIIRRGDDRDSRPESDSVRSPSDNVIV